MKVKQLMIDRVSLCGDLTTSELLCPLPLSSRFGGLRWQQDDVRCLRASPLPNHRGHPFGERHREQLAFQRFRDGRHCLRRWHPLVLPAVPSVPQPVTAPDRLSRDVSPVLHDRRRTYDHNTIQKTHRVLGQRSQMEQARRQTTQV